MKNGFKRVLGMILAIGVTGSTLCVPAQVFAADADGGLKDDFESYTVADLVTGTGSSATEGKWTMVSAAYDNKGGSAVFQSGNEVFVTEEGTNKYLKLSGNGGNSWDIAAAEYTPDSSMLGSNVEMKIDFCSDGWNYNKGGLRFMVSSDGKSYYELYTSFNAPFKLRKVTNDTENWNLDLTTAGTEQFVWYSLSLANDGDTMLWSINNHRTNETVSGKIVDEEMFELRGGAAKYQVIVASDINNNKVCFDNFSLNNIESNAENYVSQKLIAADSFESYDVMAESQHSEVETIGSNWRSSPTYRGAGWAGYMGSQIIDNNGSKVLRLVAGANGGSSYYRVDEACFNYIGDLSEVGSDVTMSVDMKAKDGMSWENKGGIRFIAHNGDKNYYTLYTDGPTAKTYFEKVVNGEVLYSEEVGGQTVGSSYYNYTMEKIGNKIKCSVIDKSNSQKIIDYTYTDEAVFNPAKLDETYQLMVHHNGEFYFDNFSLTTTVDNSYIDGTEPDNVLYRDIAAEAVKEHNSEFMYESYTFENAKTIRKVVVEGLTATQPISVYLVSAPDAAEDEWIKWGELTADGSILNTTINQTDCCLVFSNDTLESDFSIGKVKVLTDVGEDEREYTIKNNETISLYPRLAGVDCYDAWTIADNTKVTVENGVFRAVGFGATTATATSGDESFTVKFNANPPESTLYKEDFAEYTVMDEPLQGPYKTVGDWTTSGVYKGWNDGVKIQTKSDATNVIGFSGNNNIVGAIVHTLPTVYRDKPFIFKADLKSTYWDNQSGAIRFCVSEDEQTYYELIISGMSSATPTFRKVVDGNVEPASVNTTSSNLGYDFSTTWLTLEMMMNENTIIYSVKKQSDGTILWEGTYTDSEPLAPTEKISLAGSGDGLIYADNITAGSIDEFIDYQTEPQTIMYVDAAARKPVYSSNKEAGKLVDRAVTEVYSFDSNDVVIDMMGGYIIRRIKASDAEGTINCYVSNDNKTWYYLMPITAEAGEADAINTLTSNSYRYIKLASADGKASEINVLAEPTVAAVRLNSKLYLAAHIDDADCDSEEVVWSSGDIGSANVSNGVVTPVQKTSEPIIVTATDMGSSASLRISVIDSSSFTDNGDGTFTAELGTAYYTDGAKFIASGYTADDVLTGVEIVEPDCVNAGVDIVLLTFSVSANTEKIKLFCWDGGFAEMKPLFNGEEYNIN